MKATVGYLIGHGWPSWDEQLPNTDVHAGMKPYVIQKFAQLHLFGRS